MAILILMRCIVSTARLSPPALLLVLGLVFTLQGCERGLAPPPGQSARQQRAVKAVAASTSRAATGRVFEDSAAGVRFAVPAGMAVQPEHFSGVREPGVMRHMFTLTDRGEERLRVELWHNPGRSPLDTWFEAHLAFMRDGLARVSWEPVAPGQARGMLFAWPRSGQSAGQRIVLFALQDQVIRVTCQDGQDAALVAAFRALLGSFSLVEGRR